MSPLKIRRTTATAAALWLTILAARPVPLAAQAPHRLQGEIGLSLGAAFSLASAESLHRQSWTTAPLTGMSVLNTLAASPSTSFFIGGSFTRFFGRRLGLLTGFGYAKNGMPAAAAFKTGGTAAALSRRLSSSPDPSEITAVPLYAGLAVRWSGSRSALVFSAGPALILHSIVIETEAGILAATAGGTAGTGAFLAAATVPDQTWLAVGLQAGLTADLAIGSATALFFELRYFRSPRKSFRWTWASGTLPGLDDSAVSAPFDTASAAAAEAATQPLAVNPSLVQISAGLRLRLR